MHIHLNASDTAVSLVGPGTHITGDAVVGEGKLAVVLSTVGGVNVYVEGTAQTLRELVEVGLSAPVPAGVPLFDQ